MLPCAALAMGLALCGNQPATADVFLNMNFNSQANGAPITTTFPSAPSPVLNAYATGGFPDVGPYTGTNTVTSAGGLDHAALMSTDQGGIGANYIDTQFLVTGNYIQLDFDIRVVSQTGGPYPQDSANYPNGQLFAIQGFTLDSQRAFRFAITPIDATTGVFGMRNNTDGDLIPIGNYKVGNDYHVTILSNYLTNTVDTTVSGVGSLLNLPFVNPQPVDGGMEEFFFFQNNNQGSLNQIALDNIVGQTFASVPEPSSIALFGMGMTLVGGIIRRRRGN
jgi:hypothetical protein